MKAIKAVRLHSRVGYALLALALLSITACGGGDGKADSLEPLEPADFVGTWDYTSGSVNMKCPGVDITMSMSEFDPEATDVFTSGTASDLVLLDIEDGICPLNLDLQDRSAVALTGQTCSYIDEDGLAITQTVDSYSFTIGAAGAAHETASVTLVGYPDAAATCTMTVTGDLQKR